MSISLSTLPPQQLQERVKKKVLFASIFLLTAVFFMQNIYNSVRIQLFSLSQAFPAKESMSTHLSKTQALSSYIFVCPHPFLGSLTRQMGRCAPPPPVHRRFAASYSFPKNKNNLIPETKCFLSGPNSGRQGRISFHWSKLHPTELHCTLLSYAATS